MTFLQAIYAYFLNPVLTLLLWIVIIDVVLSWLVAFRVVNTQNQFVSMVGRFTHTVTWPLLSPLRRVLPTLGGVDFSPFILILAIVFVRDWVLPSAINAIARATGL